MRELVHVAMLYMHIIKTAQHKIENSAQTTLVSHFPSNPICFGVAQGANVISSQGRDKDNNFKSSKPVC
jgi:hypothetical protein